MNNFSVNRSKLKNILEDNQMAVVFSGNPIQKLGDEYFPFTPNRNFYYLTGLDRPKMIYFVYKFNGDIEEYIAIERFDEVKAKWVGAVMLPDEVRQISDIQQVIYLDEFEENISSIIFNKRIQKLYLDLENRDLYSVFGAIGGVGQALGLILLPVLSKKFTRNRVIKGAMLLSIIGYLGMGLFGPVLNQFILFAIFGIVGCMGIGCMFVAETIMLADIVDYGEFKLGYRTDSIVFSMKSLLLKVAYSIQSLIIGAGLQLSHYDGELVKQGISQPASAQNAICVMMFLIPPIFVLLSLFIFSKKYKLSKERMEEVTAFITEKHEQEPRFRDIEE